MIVFKAHAKPVYSLAFIRDGKFLVTSGGDEKVRLWSLNPVDQVREWPGSQFWGPVACSPDGLWLARGGYGICVWPIQDQEPVIQSPQFTESVAFSPDSLVFVAHGSSAALSRWTVPSGQSLPGGWGGTRESSNGKSFPTGALAYHPDGTMLAACFGVLGKRGYDSVIYLWNSNSGKVRGTLCADYASAHPTAICFSPDGSLLAAVYGPQLRIWELQTEKEIATFKVGKKHFKGLAFTADGQRLVAVNNDATVRIWDTTTWTEAPCFEWKIGKLGAVAASPDGCLMAAGGSTGKVVVWDVY